MNSANQIKRVLSRLFAGVVILSILVFQNSPIQIEQAAAPRVAYVYAADTTARDLFNTMLTGSGITVDLYDLNQAGLATTTFNLDQTIIISDDAGAVGPLPGGAFDNIQNSGKPVVGIGAGGLMFFDQASLLINSGGSISSAAYNVHAADYYAPIWQTPNQVSLLNQSMAIYNLPVSVYAFANPDTIQTITRIGRLIGDPNHYSLISQSVGARCYTLWGYRGTPDVMTPSGANLFVNLTLGSPCSEGKYTVNATLANPAPTMDGVLNYNEWNLTSNRLEMDHGFMAVMNDNLRLYVILDVLESNINNTGVNPNDFWVSFDVNNDAKITPNVDMNYAMVAGTHNMRYQMYLAPANWNFLSATTKSSLGPGFDCFTPDDTKVLQISPPAFTCAAHQIWEIAIDLHEINALPGQVIHMGLRGSSPNPAFTDELPNSFDVDFSNLIAVHLAGANIPPPTPGASIAFTNPPVEITQVVQDVNNSIPLIADKTTAGRVSVHVTGASTPQPVIEYLYGMRGGIDLPGSPLAQLMMAPVTVKRANLTDTANFLLPPSWIGNGEVLFHAEASDYNGHNIASIPQNLIFTPKAVPVYWMIQENVGTANAPNLIAQSTMDSFESYVRAVFPVSDATFVQKQWTVLGPINGADINTNVSTVDNYYNAISAVYWSLIKQNKVPPYALPDIIFGAGNFGGGISDPTWYNSSDGRAAVGGSASSGEGVVAHEFNHDLDRSSSGTWGRHVNACGASGPDPNWPFGTDPAIHEFGFDTRLPWQNTNTQKTVVPDTFPDLMSYCPSGQLPTKWIAPYRYKNWISSGFSMLAPVSGPLMPNLAPVDSLYLSGSLTSAGAGALDPVLLSPGNPITPSASGAYSIVVTGSGGATLETHAFNITFQDIEGNPLPKVYFHFILADPGGVTGIQLKHAAQVLASITKSASPPTASFTSPSGGEAFSGIKTISWTVSDSDTPLGSLRQNLEYSADNGATWMPVAVNIPGTVTTYALDTTLLSMSTQGKLRLWITDGLNNTTVDSNGNFTVPNHPPKVDILSPVADGFIPGHYTMLLQGQASDNEDLALADNNFIWTLDGSTIIGNGRSVQVVLPNGKHTLTLSVIDSSSAVGSASITVYVNQYRIYMAEIHK